MSRERREVIREVSCDLGKVLLQEVAPEALDQFATVKRRAFPHTLRDVTFGEATELVEILVPFVRAVADVLSAQGDTIYRTSARPEALATLKEEVEAVLVRLEERRWEEREKGQIGHLMEALPKVLEKRVDEILPVISPVISVSGKQREILRRCVLKIIPPDGGASTGFLLCSQGYVLTAAHVVQGFHLGDLVALAFQYGDAPNKEVKGQAQIVHIDGQLTPNGTVRDLAILKIQQGTWERWQEVQDQALRGNEPWEYPLTSPPLSLEWSPRDSVFCLGYQSQEMAAQPCGVGATIHPWDPILLTRFQNDATGREGFEYQYCMYLVPLPEAPFSYGISGGPVLKLKNKEDGEVIGMVIGTRFPSWKRYEEGGRVIWMQTPSSYGFAVPLSDVAESWPGFKRRCLAQQAS